MCRGDLPEGHLWNSSIGVPSKVIECDWCLICSAPRPGYLDPRDKWKTDDKAEALQGLSADQQASGSESGAEVRHALARGAEAT